MKACSDQGNETRDGSIFPKPIIGIVGGIGSGKSLVAAELRQLGCFVIDSDQLAHQALEEPAIIKELAEWFGDAIIGAEGKINRRKLGSMVFRNPDDLRRLNSLIHPRVGWFRQEQMEKIRLDSMVKAVVFDSPLLAETPLHQQCNAIIYVDAPVHCRQKRVMESRGWDAAELTRRENFQMALDKKKKIAQYTVINDGEPTLLSKQVREVFTTVLARFGD